jgi:hypothetical protein
VGGLVAGKGNRLVGGGLLKLERGGAAENENGRHQAGGQKQQDRQQDQDQSADHPLLLGYPCQVRAKPVHDTTVRRRWQMPGEIGKRG